MSNDGCEAKMAKDKSPDISPSLKEPSPYKTIKEAAEYLRATEWYISEAIRAGDLPYAKIGKRFVICTADLDAYFERQKDGR
jgi:excisionase family DNA binding protein